MNRCDTSSRPSKNKRKKKRKKAREQSVLSVISVRISDDEKERIEEIMRAGNIRRYSDIVRMAILMYRGPNSGEYGASDIYH